MELRNSHRKNRRYAYLNYAKNYDKRNDKFCLRVLRGGEGYALPFLIVLLKQYSR